MSSIKSLALLALATGFATVSRAQDVSGSGTTTRYWDCCKGSCAWSGKADVSNPVTTCDIKDQPLAGSDAASGCESGGEAYMCSDQSPWAVSDSLAYGFAAVSIPGGSESSWCCACYELTFTSTAIAGKKMVVQATNTGGDLSQGQFDLAMPGGGVGLFNGCTDEWGAPSSGWGAQYGGISTDTCSTFPTALQPGCSFRFGDFFQGADNPTVDYKQVTCPKALTDKTGCVRSGETPTGSDSDSSSSAAPAASSTTDTVPSSAAPASSSAAPASSSAAASSDISPAETLSEAAPVASSAAASSPASSAPASSEAASFSSTVSSSQYVSSAYSFTSPSSSALGSSSSPVAPVGTGGAPAPSGYSSGGDACAVRYVYEYE